ncbi:MAG TPA: type II toxin-antitoxin system prevent-host-death family antitoxin [Spirochaeta sp.]|nr:type II toxin-antitoxin system prevent-host-death family antitoxin [Spirochaeta sp.]
MITVGIRNLRNSLSKYINLVKNGETVLITDHNKIVAEIIPAELSERNDSFLKSYIDEQSQAGKMIKATMNTKIDSTGTEEAVDSDLIIDIYNESRKERL